MNNVGNLVLKAYLNKRKTLLRVNKEERLIELDMC